MTVAVATGEPSQASTGALLNRLLDEVPPAVEPDDFVEQAQSRTGLDAIEPRSLSVAYLLPGLPPEGSGGSHSLVQEARGLRKLGARARVCVPAGSLPT